MRENGMEIEGTDLQNEDYRRHISTAERFKWFEGLDELLDEENIVLDALKRAVNNGNMTPDDAKDNLETYIDYRLK